MFGASDLGLPWDAGGGTRVCKTATAVTPLQRGAASGSRLRDVVRPQRVPAHPAQRDGQSENEQCLTEAELARCPDQQDRDVQADHDCDGDPSSSACAARTQDFEARDPVGSKHRRIDHRGAHTRPDRQNPDPRQLGERPLREICDESFFEVSHDPELYGLDALSNPQTDRSSMGPMGKEAVRT